MSPVCHSFVQNAWKKDFCSNCFKSREEHVKNDRASDAPTYLPTPFQNKNAFFKRTPPSILKIHPKKKNKRNVRFPEEVCSVIGYGGDDWSDGEEFEMSQDNDVDDSFPDTEEERELHKITKSNTDFNTVKANLLGDSTAKSYTSLMLGKMQTDSAGKKKTLMVSVTPFGQENKGAPIKAHIRKPAVVINITGQGGEAPTNGYKTSIIVSTSVKESETIISSEGVNTTGTICTEKSLLEEISETLKQNRIGSGTDLSLSQNDKPTIVEGKMKESMSDDYDKKEMTETKKNNSLVRKSPLSKTQERPKVNLARSEFKFCKINVDNSSVDSAVDTLNSTANNSLASDDESFSGRTDSDNDDSGHFSETNKCEETVQIKVFSESDKNLKFSPIGQMRNVDGQAGTGYSTFQAPVIDMPPIIPKQTESIFSAEASRELAGEPDGRADPDEPTEAPALPNTPVPTMDPRPSFLHGMISDLVSSTKPAVPEKPKLPLKPVIKHTTKKGVINPPQQQGMTQISKREEDEKVLRCLSEEKNNEITEVHEDKPEPIYYAKPVLTKQDSDTSLHSLSKRKAPTPPSSPSVDEVSNNIYQRNPSGYAKSDSPVVREMEKRERATLSSPPKPKPVDETSAETKKVEVTPEPAVYVKNRLPHSANTGNIPEEIWSEKSRNLDNLRIFGSIAYVHISKEKRKKWEAKAKEYLFIGYCEETKGYRFADLSNPRKIVIGRDVIFTEDSDLSSETSSTVKISTSPEAGTKPEDAVTWEINHSSNKVQVAADCYEDAVESSDDEGDEDDQGELNQCSKEPDIDLSGGESSSAQHIDDEGGPRYPFRNRLREECSGLFCYNSTNKIEEEPRTYKETLSRPDCHEWQKAMRLELDSRKEHDVWKVVDKPPGAKVVGNKWIYRFKYTHQKYLGIK